jgi:hypothetical protein
MQGNVKRINYSEEVCWQASDTLNVASAGSIPAFGAQVSTEIKGAPMGNAS